MCSKNFLKQQIRAAHQTVAAPVQQVQDNVPVFSRHHLIWRQDQQVSHTVHLKRMIKKKRIKNNLKKNPAICKVLRIRDGSRVKRGTLIYSSITKNLLYFAFSSCISIA